MFYTIVEFHDDDATLNSDNNEKIIVKRDFIPRGCSEGDILVRVANGYRLDKDQTESRRGLINILMDDAIID